jgi:hypothetical protein
MAERYRPSLGSVGGVPIARFKDLCFDVTDPAVVANFWARALGQQIELHDDGDASVHGPRFPRIWLNRVPEPKVVKNRVHLDLEVEDVSLLEALGATVVSATGDWTVLADPEGNELCASPEETSPVIARAFALCVDCERPVELAAWWQKVLGGQLVPAPDGTPRWLLGAAGLGDLAWKFIPVPEARSVKNRLHWDVTAESVRALLDVGATLLRASDDEISWSVLADPEGNEFCAFTPS